MSLKQWTPHALSPRILTRMARHRERVIQEWRAGKSLARLGKPYRYGASTMKQLLLHWVGEETYEAVTCSPARSAHNPVPRQGIVMRRSMQALRDGLYIRRWAGFSAEERRALEQRVIAWQTPEARALRQGQYLYAASNRLEWL